MNSTEAEKKLDEGMRICLPEWGEDSYLYRQHATGELCLTTLGGRYSWHVALKYMNRDDWKVWEVVKETPEELLEEVCGLINKMFHSDQYTARKDLYKFYAKIRRKQVYKEKNK